MSKFKVGDRVKVVSHHFSPVVGKIGLVRLEHVGKGFVEYLVEVNSNPFWCYEDDLVSSTIFLCSQCKAPYSTKGYAETCALNDVANKVLSNPQSVKVKGDFLCKSCGDDFFSESQAEYCEKICSQLNSNDVNKASEQTMSATSPINIRCECGSEACGSNRHSSYCPKFKENS